MLLLVLCVILPALPELARGAEAEEGPWSYDIAPYYLWGVGLDGTVTVMGTPSDVDISFGDLADDLSFIFDAHFEARHEGGWGLVFEPMFIALESATPVQGGDLLVENTIVMMEGLAIRGLGSSERRLALLFGARYMRIENEIQPPGMSTIEGRQSWTDGVVGLRYGPQLSERWALNLRGDLGAGGSDLTWQIALLAFFDMTRHSQLAFGYRHLDIDYRDGAGSTLFGFDAALSGPIVGVNFTF
jgi:hypothetical protein